MSIGRAAHRKVDSKTMAQERPNRFAEWIVLLRNNAPALGHRIREYAAAARQHPILLWETPAIRYAVYGTAVVTAAWLLAIVGRSFLPDARDARPPATTADFHVVCVNAQCGHHFVINREFGFRKFPVECPACKAKSGMRAVRCASPECQGRWVVPRSANEKSYCPACGREFPSP